MASRVVLFTAASRVATRERLKRWDVTDTAIDRLERTGDVSTYLTVQAPFDGIVLERNVFAGQYVTPEMMTFKIADLSTIWALGEVFEYELPRVSVGQEVVVELPYGQSTKVLAGRLSFVSPQVDPATRRIKIRAEFKNPVLALKPETFVTLVLHGEARDELLVPREAVLDNGVRQYALIALPDGYFEPRDIEVGPAQGEFYPVMGGLRDGDNVVTSAQFLIDSETNLKSAMQGMAASMPGMDMGNDARGGSTKSVPAMPGMNMGNDGKDGSAQPAPEMSGTKVDPEMKMDPRMKMDPPAAGSSLPEHRDGSP